MGKNQRRALGGFVRRGQPILDSASATAKDKGHDVTGYGDIRKLLANNDIDAISIATPNHWHATAMIWSLQAGKDVYVEKPISHNVKEGEQMVQAAKQYGKIVQVGTQSRSSEAIKEAVEWVQGRQPRKNHCLPRVLLQTPRKHRQDHWAATCSGDG